ncbi:MAG: nucleotidyltransferase family protein [Porticoccus sp.]|nr:nucleotidyltransferase family protein [Porticoccus sp.]
MRCLLIELLLKPEKVAELTDKDWDDVIPQARITALLATLYLRLKDNDLLEKVPVRPRSHLYSAWIVHNKQKESLEYELRWLLRAFSGINEPLIVLKGAAYILADLPGSRGRLISDIDLLTQEKSLDKVERGLNEYGWLSGDQDSYDERYYRKWMHEIPPLGHETRESTLDVHHTILPPTTNAMLDSNKLFSDLVEARKNIFVLSPVDMVLHSAAHLFHEGGFQHGLRDLWDLNRLLRDFGESVPDFWAALLPRARELNLIESLFYALRYVKYFFETPIPEGVLSDTGQARRGRQAAPLMDFLFLRVFLPDHPSCRPKYYGVTAFCLYIRSHYLRMPLYLLLPHLARKAWRGWFGRSPEGREEEFIDRQGGQV